MKGLRLERSGGSKPNLIVFEGREAPRRGGGINNMEPPPPHLSTPILKVARPWGGKITINSPRWFIARIKPTVWKGGRRGFFAPLR